MEHKCQVETYRGAVRIQGVGAYSPCGKPTTTLLPDGTWVCRYHSPKAIAKREEEREFHILIKEINRRKGFGRKQRTI